ncbi:MAG: STAS domain-containing protein [Spirochaetes bacterium]|nr:STAS domain-containing protein [Spirochaetota bacterium]MBN2770546.1 STAS domain-containing protein [Spirochaetota bacterium]HRX15034.1 STAS domain-containing protein [Spirochaetota bacterium]
MSELIMEQNSSVKTVSNIKKQLLQIIDSEKELVIDFKSITSIDLAIAQLLISAVKYARKKSVAVKFKNVSDEIRNQLQLTGLIKRNKE